MTSRNVRILNRNGYYLEVLQTGEIKGTKVPESSAYAEVTIRTVDFGKVTLQGTKTLLNIYIKSNGDLATTSLSSHECRECVWKEEYAHRPGYLQYSSTVYPKWLLGITKRGKTKKGTKTNISQRATEWITEPIRSQ